MNNQEQKASEKYWEKYGFYQGDEKYCGFLENKDKATYDKLVALEAKIELLKELYNTQNDLQKELFDKFLFSYTHNLSQLKEQHGLKE